MKITHWNFFGNEKILSGAKRYENELFAHISNVQRFNRTDNLKYNNPDITHATFQMLSPLKLLKRPQHFVLTVHDIIPSTQYTTLQKLRELWYISEHCIQYADAIIVDSKFTKKELITRLKIHPDKITVIPLGVSKNYKLLDKQACRKMFDFAPDKKYILIVSSNKPWKNMKLANEIIDSLSSEYKFIKVGYGEYLDNSNVINLGVIPESRMPYLYNACDLFIHTSLYEGFGLPILETMSCGLPVISSNSSSLPEVVKDAGFLISPHKKELFISTIRYVLNNEDLYNIMRDKGIRNAAQFTWERTAEETIKVYNKLLNTIK